MLARDASSKGTRRTAETWPRTLKASAPVLLAVPLIVLKVGSGRLGLVLCCLAMGSFAMSMLLIRRGWVVIESRGRTRWWFRTRGRPTPGRRPGRDGGLEDGAPEQVGVP